MATYLVTGAAGYIASYLIPALLQQGHRVVALDRLPCPGHLANRKKLHWQQTDLTDPTLLQDLFQRFKPSLCVHLAKPDYRELDLYTPGERLQAIDALQFSSPAILAAVNHYLVLLEAAIRFGKVPVVMGSSDSVYGPNMSARVCERSAQHPISAKGLMNFMMEQSSRYYALRYGLDVTVARFFNIYGPWRPEWCGDVISRFCCSMMEADRVQLYGNGLQQRDFVFIEEAVHCLERLIQAHPSGYAAFNICTSRGVSILQLVNMIAAVIPPQTGFTQKSDIDFQPARPGDLHCAIGANDKLYRQVGFKPDLPLAEGIRRTLEGVGFSTLRRLTT
ncbi:NAD-dependent epimerase/dehydratase family protein [Bacterioplanoides sp.]|uniref:NAD-dependent epimerase/dehydratase family protein n=1 Tax=Bacterioplanoides sp. TaxID=2066072 RepID=UPI003B003C2D